MISVLFVCTGNSCRSVIAEGLFKKALRDRQIKMDVDAASAGTSPLSGMLSPPGAIKASRELDVDISAHKATMLTRGHIKESDFILAMDERHKKAISRMDKDTQKKTFLLKEFMKGSADNLDIQDPIGQPLVTYQKCAQVINKSLDGFIDSKILPVELDIALGSDHAGYALKEAVKVILKENNYSYTDFGSCDANPVDYPDYAHLVARAVAEGKNGRGILICTTGLGMSIAANKVATIRAALCLGSDSAKLSRLHNNANILALASKYVKGENLSEMLHIWLTTGFTSDERHLRRLKKIRKIEQGGLV